MTTWRWPSRQERATDFAYLGQFLEPRIAADIAAMPVVVAAPYAPFDMRADAWLYRVQRDRQAWQAPFSSSLFPDPTSVEEAA